MLKDANCGREKRHLFPYFFDASDERSVFRHGRYGLYGKITLVGIAKRLEELYFPHDPLPLYLDKKSESLKVIQQLRDEAHRFGITHHRSRLEKGTIKSELTSIEGVGFATAQKLLWKFKSVKNIKKASFDDLAAAVGKTKARIVHDYFSSGKQA